MPGFEATETPNFFKNNFTNHVKPINNFALKVLSHLFAKATKYALTMGLRDWAEAGQDGKNVY